MIRESRFTTPLKGLICRSCIDIITETLMTRKGILSVTVSYIKGVADITYDPDVIRVEEIKTLLEDTGYPPSDKARGGLLYDILTVICTIVVFILLEIIPLPHIPLISEGTANGLYLNVFLIGLVTGTHCIVMCGGIMLSSIEKTASGAGRFSSIILYNTARIFTSTLLGFIFGSIGKVIVFSYKMRSMFYVFIGLYVIFSALRIWGFPIIRELQAAFPKLCPFIIYRKSTAPLVLGILTALMPCSASSTMWMTAMTLNSGIKGALMMALWALGTLPAMLVFALLSGRKKGRYYGLTTRINIVLLLSLGLRLVMMGI